MSDEMNTKYKVLVNALLQNAEKGYSKGSLRFKDDAITAVLTALEPDRVSELHKILEGECE